MFHVGGIGPMQGQAIIFVRYAPEKIPFCIKRYTEETKRLYTVLNSALEGKDYLVGNTYTLADAINYPWVRIHALSGVPDIDDLPNLKAWIARIDARPATQKGLNVPTPDRLKELIENPEKLEELVKSIRSSLFNSTEKK
jgi:glutathione S-transferase